MRRPPHGCPYRLRFLHGVLKEDVYMSQPLGFVTLGQEGKVCHLLKSLYGLKQSPRAWYEKIDSSLRHVKLKLSFYDPICTICIKTAKSC